MKKVTLVLLLLLASLNASAESKENAKPAVPGHSETIDEKANDTKTCAKKLERFHKSQDCFVPYQNVNGTMKPGAFENCTDIKYPTECQYSS